ncbi:SubName: Full=Uncharacterized protein {ECO:0000313/EMBL:CCA72460.1} [Serendipita indica DSM 11827]|uniref:MYND-type domain-containing protein n=1 Tax=Serendipita indica (strain DSM 11827) TaxID=1109443 RepID=G4TMB1_SERID|nr:SubName: Full=Uncharacterized protein {ECO:0000313/EMBL:CCA72460.1} [Serendipita indica DSM 11827]CCA72460.1 hypothetical protein PIIN_06396 [Serendipita indica DSM 11827]
MSHLARPIISHPCTVCGEPTHNWCSRCQATWYCSTDHLNADWRRHRQTCVPFVAQQPLSPTASPIHFTPDASPQPASSATFSALFFPADEDRPRVVRVNCTPASPRSMSSAASNASSASGRSVTPPQQQAHALAIAATAARPCQWDADTKPWLQSANVGSVVLTHGLNGEPLRFPLHLFYVPDALAKGTPVNRSIYKLTNGLAPRKWSGNVIALKYSGTRRQAYSDCTTNDLPALVSYFLSFV